MTIWTAIGVYTDTNDFPQLFFHEVFDDREKAIKYILDSFYLELKDSNNKYKVDTPCEAEAKKILIDWGVLSFKDDSRKLRWYLRKSKCELRF